MKRLALPLVLLVASGGRADDKALEGTWVSTAAKQNGEDLPAAAAKGATLVLVGDKYTATFGGVEETGTFAIDRTKKPPSLTMKPAGAGKRPAPKGKSQPAIFDLDGDTLKVCFSLETGKPPTDFTSTAENKHFVVTYARKK